MTSEQLERAAERNRANLANTLDELRDRLTPGEMLDGALSYTKDGGAAFISNLGDQMSANPLPVTLVGVGLAWFLMSKGGNGEQQSRRVSTAERTYGNANPYNGTSSRNGNGRDNSADEPGLTDKAYDAASDAMGSLKSGYASATGAVGDTATRMANSVSDTASRFSADVRDTASGAVDTAKAQMAGISRTASQSADAIQDAAVKSLGYLKEQPLILTALGIAIGAALGAALPSSEIENQLMGETADDIKAQAKDVASEQLDRAKDIGGDILDKAKDAGKDIYGEVAREAQDGVKRFAEDDELGGTSSSGDDDESAGPPSSHSSPLH